MRWAGNRCWDRGTWQLTQLVTGWPKGLFRCCPFFWARCEGVRW